MLSEYSFCSSLLVLRKTKIDKPFTLHQLRHTFATRALKAGIPISVVSKWLGHASKSGGPQGRLVLQDTALDGSGAFRSANQTPCTVWPRTVMRGGSRRVNSGPNSVP